VEVLFVHCLVFVAKDDVSVDGSAYVITQNTQMTAGWRVERRLAQACGPNKVNFIISYTVCDEKENQPQELGVSDKNSTMEKVICMCSP